MGCLIYNGNYQGCYQLCEHIRIGKQLVDIEEWEPNQDTIDGGFLLELGADYQKESANFTTKKGIGVCVSSPSDVENSPEALTWLQDYFQSVEDALTSPTGYNTKNVHYSDLIDFDSFVSYWLCNEILANEDAAQRSRFCYIDKGGKLTFGPVWDFDIGSGSYKAWYGPRGWSITKTANDIVTKQDLWKDVFNQPLFQSKAKEQYEEIRPFLESIVCDDGMIDTYKDYLYEAACQNEILWVSSSMKRSFTGEKGDVAIYKNFLKQRIEWLDKFFKVDYVSESDKSDCACSHKIIEVKEREASKTHYGIASCYYCTECKGYFTDSNGKEKLKPEQIITSPATSNKPGGVILNVRQLIALGIVLITILVSSLVLLVVKLKKRRHRKRSVPFVSECF